MSNQLVVSAILTRPDLASAGGIERFFVDISPFLLLQRCVLNQGISQGTVFERVIQEVCDASQVDFEESGVDQQTLSDLRKVNNSLFYFSLPVQIDGISPDGARSGRKRGEAERCGRRCWCWGSACL
jgi:hypothetical protein